MLLPKWTIKDVSHDLKNVYISFHDLFHDLLWPMTFPWPFVTKLGFVCQLFLSEAVWTFSIERVVSKTAGKLCRIPSRVTHVMGYTRHPRITSKNIFTAMMYQHGCSYVPICDLTVDFTYNKNCLAKCQLVNELSHFGHFRTQIAAVCSAVHRQSQPL